MVGVVNAIPLNVEIKRSDHVYLTLIQMMEVASRGILLLDLIVHCPFIIESHCALLLGTLKVLYASSNNTSPTLTSQVFPSWAPLRNVVLPDDVHVLYVKTLTFW